MPEGSIGAATGASITPTSGGNTAPLSKAALDAKAKAAGQKADEILISLNQNEINAMRYTMPGADAAAAYAKLQNSNAISAGEAAAADTQRQAIQGIAGMVASLGPVFQKMGQGRGGGQGEGSPEQPPEPPRSSFFGDLFGGGGGTANV